jgi:hypothetical protein
MDANAEKGAHALQVTNVSHKQRAYQGVCLDCDWTGNATTGAQAYAEMGDHSVATLPARGTRASELW